MEKYVFIVVEREPYERSRPLFVGNLEGVNNFTGEDLQMNIFDELEEMSTDNVFVSSIVLDDGKICIYRTEFNQPITRILFM